ncbi:MULTISPECIES: LacI family DNA-binding transcriptional regulator [Sediminispirochaeta]|uniref:Transcriptional regulator, LacI family n=1 Tax=Sediminispirochaeta smaragdinae (strain DSM 11293 / JCM 15392 / SEBR 4228) TaxID=573413 RepID=E1R2F7_SEDSS|nr:MULTISPECIES: LacI family DNA-binding transcriptional regulator [Sediminispirochaeta]ADK82517.1 transcriptional regulator, LacI family [Sediminispirochaeta smaragdinae DSM 11293]
MTIKDIAKQAGVSIGTVDRVLHNRGRVSVETARRIRAIVKESGYKPNMYASTLSSSRHYTLAALTPRHDQDGGFWELPAKGLLRAETELEQFSIHVVRYEFDRYSEDSFRQEAERIIADRPDGLIIAPVLPSPARRLIDALKGNIPYVLFDSNLPETTALAFIGQDSYCSGILAGKLMKLLSPNPDTCVIIQSVIPDVHITGRINGFLSQYADDEKPPLVIEEHIEDRNVCTKFMDTLLSQRPEVEGIFVTNASCHRVAEYLEQRFPQGSPIKVIGYDLIPPNKECLKRGYIDFIISQRPERQGFEAVYTLYRKLVLKREPSSRIVMPLDILTKENVDFYR